MIPANPSIGIDATSGRIVNGWAHVLQSLSDIYTTGFGERVIREWYGSFVPHLLGRLITPEEVTPFFVAITSAIEQWEPRYRVSEIKVLKATRDGALHFYIDGEYRPRAMFGDFTVEGARRVNGSVNAAGLIIRAGEMA